MIDKNLVDSCCEEIPLLGLCECSFKLVHKQEIELKSFIPKSSAKLLLYLTTT